MSISVDRKISCEDITRWEKAEKRLRKTYGLDETMPVADQIDYEMTCKSPDEREPWVIPAYKAWRRAYRLKGAQTIAYGVIGTIQK